MLVLASASPRRQELLRNAGIEFTVSPANIHESQLAGENAMELVTRLASAKAESVRQRMASHWTGSPLFVLGADTVVLLDGCVLGKPRDAQDAERMLRVLSGRTHEVITGVCLAGGHCAPFSEISDCRAEATQVSFDIIEEDEIRTYAASREPMDKAGAYAIQGIASRWVRKLEGDYCNVVGLPIRLVYRMLGEHRVIGHRL